MVSSGNPEAPSLILDQELPLDDGAPKPKYKKWKIKSVTNQTKVLSLRKTVFGTPLIKSKKNLLWGAWTFYAFSLVYILGVTEFYQRLWRPNSVLPLPGETYSWVSQFVYCLNSLCISFSQDEQMCFSLKPKKQFLTLVWFAPKQQQVGFVMFKNIQLN